MKPRPLTLCLIATFLLSFAYSVFFWRQTINQPPTFGDGPEYEAIGFSLWKGQGYGFKFADPEFRRPYQEGNYHHQHDLLLQRKYDRLTAYRPPLYPFFIATTYFLGGRNFALLRMLNGFFIAGAITLGLLLCFELGGWGAVALYLLFQGLGARSDHLAYFGFLHTEALSAFGLTLLATLFCHLKNTASWSKVAGLGMLMGLLVLLRNNFLLWFPGWIGLTYLVLRNHREPFWQKKPLTLSFLSLAAALFVISPWAIRNTLQLRTFLPMGTMGSVLFQTGFGEVAFKAKGAWVPPYTHDIFAVPLTSPEEGLQKEKELGDKGVGEGMQWVRTHLNLLPLLTWGKVADLWRPDKFYHWILYLAAVLSLLLHRNRREIWILASFPFFCTLGVAATWSVGFRFLYPLLPLLCCLASVSLWQLFLFVKMKTLPRAVEES